MMPGGRYTRVPVADIQNPRPPDATASTVPDRKTETAAPRVVAVLLSNGTASTAPSLANSRWPVGDHTGVVARSMTTDRWPLSIDTASIRSVPGSEVRLANSTRRSPGSTSGRSWLFVSIDR
jgi:hypothetical protein